MRIFVVDVETTGLDPKEHAVCEVAATEIEEGSDGAWRVGDGLVSLVNPNLAIPPEASAVHHIVDEDVASAPYLTVAVRRVLPPELFPLGDDAGVVFAAHNSPFDESFLPELHRKSGWIDTCRCARHLWPDAPGFSNQVLRYWSKITVPTWAKRDERGPHSALFDTAVTAALLCRMLETHSFVALLSLSVEPVVLRKVSFGKHAGQLWTETPSDYLSWAAKQDFGPDIKFTIKHELERRRGK